MISITIIIIAITAIISFSALSNQRLMDQLIFDPPAVSEGNQWYRFLSCALIHADMAHLIFNMISLYFFGELVEQYFKQMFGQMGPLLFIALYVLSQFFCLLPTYIEHKHNHYYRSLGASGAVSAVVFAGIFLEPTMKIGLFLLPPIIPGFIFGPLYLIISAYLAKQNAGNINHSAHIWGAVAGIVLLLAFGFALTDYNLLTNFVMKVQRYFN